MTTVHTPLADDPLLAPGDVSGAAETGSVDARGRPIVAPVAALLAGAAIGVTVADGSPAWQGVRVVIVGLLTFGVARVLTRRDGWAGLASVGWGAISLAIGVGIGLPHLTKAGMGILTVAGLVALTAGLVLLATGTATLVRRTRGWRRIPIVLGVVVTTVLLLLVLGQAVAVTNVPRTEVDADNPGRRDLVYQDVTFETADGVTLSGWYIPSRNRAAVVLLHGAGSTRSSVLDQAEVLADHGFGVLAFDARGHGRSGGRAMDFGWYGDLDTRAAVDFVVDRGEVDDDRVGAVGMSMGGEEAIGAAAADPRIQAVIAEGATVRVAEDKSWLSDEYGPQGQLQEGIEAAVFGIADLLTEADPPIPLREAVAVMAPRPVFLIAAGQVPDEALAADHIRTGSPETVDIWEVPGAAHTDGLDTQPEKWEAQVTTFLTTSLLERTQPG